MPVNVRPHNLAIGPALVERLRADAGRKTLGELIQEREAAACEIERLCAELALFRAGAKAPTHLTKTGDRPAEPMQLPHWHDRALLRLRDVCEIVGLSRSTIYSRMADGRFPTPLRVSGRAMRWRTSDVAAWVRSPTP